MFFSEEKKKTWVCNSGFETGEGVTLKMEAYSEEVRRTLDHFHLKT